MTVLHEFFTLNRPLVLFVYGQTFFILGLAIFLQSRRHSRLRLARDLRWLAGFGLLHGIHEWGDVFIPIQATFLPRPYVELLLTLHVLVLASSFLCLLAFGAVTLERRWPWGRKFVIGVGALWAALFWFTLYPAPTVEQWHQWSAIWARYLLGFPGSLLAAYGLRYQAETSVKPLGVTRIYNTLRVAGFALLAYAVLGGLIVGPGNFFPANVLNRETIQALIGIPIEVFRSTIGLILAVSMIRALEVFEIEIDRLIEDIEVERIQSAERDRIGQEIHDGAVQAVYSASLILESIGPYLIDNVEAALRLDRAERVLSSAVSDLRRYMISLRSDTPHEPLVASLRALVSDPRFSTLLNIQLKLDADPDLNPLQVGHALAIVQESLSNAVRHANARHMTISTCCDAAGWLLRIEDDGKGFDEKTAVAGFGLRAMRDRARLLGGTLNIRSRPGKGTTITLLIPEERIHEGAALAAGR
jgi:signal transduction histidine kinase